MGFECTNAALCILLLRKVSKNTCLLLACLILLDGGTTGFATLELPALSFNREQLSHTLFSSCFDVLSRETHWRNASSFRIAIRPNHRTGRGNNKSF